MASLILQRVNTSRIRGVVGHGLRVGIPPGRQDNTNHDVQKRRYWGDEGISARSDQGTLRHAYADPRHQGVQAKEEINLHCQQRKVITCINPG